MEAGHRLWQLKSSHDEWHISRKDSRRPELAEPNYLSFLSRCLTTHVKQMEALPKTEPKSRILYWLLLASLVPWTCLAVLTAFAFDAPGSENNSTVWRIVISIWCYPLLVVFCAGVGFALRCKGLWRAGRVVLAVPLTIAALAVVALGVTMVSMLVQDHQAAKTSPNVRYLQAGLTEIPAEVFTRPTPVDSLNLSGNRLTSLPARIAQLKHLRYLSLSNNQLTSLPAEIGELTELKELRLEGNRLESLPPEFARLVNLRLLSMDGAAMKEFPLPLTTLKGLETLRIVEGAFISLPAEISEMRGLKDVSFLCGQLVALPDELGLLTNLTTLDLSQNQLASVPAELGLLTNLTTLDLSQNQLASVPAELANLSALSSLNLNENRLKTLPADLAEMPQLDGLYLFKNPLETLPPEVEALPALRR